MEETLTKDNFWNEMCSKYPETMKKFSIWIDEYKRKHDWHLLFNPKRSIKFHDLPIAMQAGIICEFLSEQSVTGFDFSIDWHNYTFSNEFSKIEESLVL